VRSHPFHFDVFHDGVVQGLVAETLADLDHAGNLVRLGFADEVADGGGDHEDFQGGDASLLVDSFEEVLGDHTAQGFGQAGSDLVLLFGREDVDDTVDRLGGALGVKRSEHQVTGAGGGERQFDRLEIAHFADEDDVGVLAQGAFEGGGERARVEADFAMVDERGFAFVDEFDRVLDGEDVVFPVLVRVIHHGGQGGGLAGAGGAGHQDQAFVEHGELLEYRRQRGVELLEILEGQHLAGDLAKDRGDAVFLIEKIGAKAGNAWNLVAEIDIARFFVNLDLIFRRDFVKHRLESVALERRVLDAEQFAVDAENGRVAGGKMEVRGFLLHHEVEESVNLGHKSLRLGVASISKSGVCCNP